MKRWQAKLFRITKIDKAFSTAVTLTFITGISCSAIASFIVWHFEQTKITYQFEHQGANVAAAINNKLEQNLQNLQSIVNFYHASDKVTRQEFHQFVHNYIIDNPEIEALKWTPRVTQKERETYERAARLDGLTQFEITERDRSQRIIRAKSRAEYFPVYYVNSKKDDKSGLGFDLASQPSLMEAMYVARDTGRAIATAPIILKRENGVLQKGFLVFLPVYYNHGSTDTVAERRQNLEGFVVGVFRLGVIADLARYDLQATDIDLVVADESAPLENRLFYTSDSSLKLEATKNIASYRSLQQQFLFDSANRRLSITIIPASGYFQERMTFRPILVLSSGILLTAILAFYLQEMLKVRNKLRTQESIAERSARDYRKVAVRYRRIVDNVAEGIFICTQEGKYLNANNALANIYGYDSPQQLLSEIKNVETQLFVNPEDWRKLIAAVKKDRTVTNFECQVYRADGSKIWTSINIHWLSDRNNSEIYYEGTVTNITARKQTEQLLLQSNNLLTGISQAQTRFIKDAEPKILFDGLLENLLQITNSEYGFIGEILYTETQEPCIEAYMKVRGKPYLKSHAITNIAWNEETRKFYDEHAPQGMEFHNLKTLFGQVMVTGKPVIANSPSTDPRRGGLPDGYPPLNAFLGLPFYSRDRLLGMVGIANRPHGYDTELVEYLEPFLATCSNIIEAYRSETKRQQVEKALKESEERYRAIVETANEGILLLDSNGQIRFANSKVSQMLGYGKDELIRRSLFNFMDKQQKIEKTLTNLELGMTKNYDLQFRCQDGSKLWTLASFSSIFDSSFQSTGILAMITDISDRKQTELELAAAKQTAEIASRTKSHFLSNMSHELRTPLNGILGSTRLLKSHLKAMSSGNSVSTVDCQKNLNTIETSGSHLLGLIEDILEFSRIETAPVKLYPTRIDLVAFLTDICNTLRSRITVKGLTFTTEIPRDLPYGIEVDRQRLKQVLLELFNNAIKFTDLGRITFRIVVIDYCEFLPTPSNSEVNLQDYITLRFEAIDTGVGIGSDLLTKIFQPFEQLGDIHNKAAGTGIGLTIAQQLLHSMNSKLKVTSCLGMGSTFWFDLTLPTLKTGISKTEKPIEVNSIVGYQGKKRRLLIVDNRAENRLLLINLLEPLGFEVFTAENGQQEIGLAKKIKPDLILTDLILPLKTGFEAVQELRQIPYFEQTPIIAISNSDLEPEREQKRIAGCDALLAKPIDESKLLALLQKYLQLSWIYRDELEAVAIAPEPDSVPKSVDSIVPPVEDLEFLYELAMLGSMKKIRQWAVSLEELDIKYKPFADKLKNLSQNFEEKAIVSLVEQYLHQ
ncbi:CHASE domain-containing protein [Myxosarcina sp. GI1]|uniref:CHASE domain-containing protein n=1 Tax=Myxosarcina sp. GI1 TaxID=1541065 RepID=UPI00068D5ACD|nr:CHASE domain-containing protein [Myxosarcina sp. GI1]